MSRRDGGRRRLSAGGDGAVTVAEVELEGVGEGEGEGARNWPKSEFEMRIARPLAPQRWCSSPQEAPEALKTQVWGAGTQRKQMCAKKRWFCALWASF